MKTVAKWYPDPEQVTYSSPYLDQERAKNPSMTLVGAVSLALRRSRVKLTLEGKRQLQLITELLELKEFQARYDLKCGCRCGCSPGFRILAPGNPEPFHSRHVKVFLGKNTNSYSIEAL